MPAGLSPVFDEEPEWLRNGIGAYLVDHGADPETEREESRAQSAPQSEFEHGLVNPFAEVKDAGRTTGKKTMEFGKAGEDTDWLLEEWAEFDEDLNKLRAMRSTSAATPDRQTLPANLPEDWDAERSMAAAAQETTSPVNRGDSQPDDPSWEPQPLEGHVNPESFFLPPEEQ